MTRIPGPHGASNFAPQGVGKLRRDSPPVEIQQVTLRRDRSGSRSRLRLLVSLFALLLLCHVMPDGTSGCSPDDCVMTRDVAGQGPYRGAFYATLRLRRV